MSLQTYGPRQTYVGAGNLSAYTFSFTIQALSQLLVVVYDASKNQIAKVRGTDTSVLISSVTFDAVAGGGTVNLLSNLTTGYTIVILEANDAPTQPSIFRNKFSFSLEGFELALDFLGAAIQRLAYLGKRSVRLNEIDDVSVFDPTLPPNMGNAMSLIPSTKSDGTGWDVITNWTPVANLTAAVTAAIAAAASATAAVTAATSAAASATSATASAATATTKAAAASTSATAAAASATAAAASATSLALNVQGTSSVPLLITASGSMPQTPSGVRNKFYIKGNAAPKTVTVIPQIPAGSAEGSILRLVGCDSTNWVQYGAGTSDGLQLNGPMTLKAGDILDLDWDNTASLWVETNRNIKSV